MISHHGLRVLLLGLLLMGIKLMLMTLLRLIAFNLLPRTRLTNITIYRYILHIGESFGVELEAHLLISL